MKRFFLLLCVICVLYGLSWAGNLGESTEGKLANPSLAHTAKLDSAKFVFYYPYGNGYVIAYGYPDDDDSLNVVDTTIAGVDLDSIGSHFLKVTYYPHSGGSTIVYGQWVHIDPTPGDTIQRDASTFDPSTDTVAYVDSLIEPLTLTSVDSVRKVYLVDSLDQTVTASADTEAIARYNWNYVTRTLTSGVGAGTGSNQVIIRTKSSTDSAVIPGASVALWNADQSALMGLLETDTDSGKAVFAQNDGTYNLRIWTYKFQWTVPIPIGVSGNKDTTVYATEFTPSPPPSSDLCTVYGYIDSIGLVGQRAQISCTILEHELRIGTKILAYYSYTKTVFTTPSGYWEMFLPPNAIITPSGTEYVFEIKTPYQPVLKKWVTVPELANWEFIF